MERARMAMVARMAAATKAPCLDGVREYDQEVLAYDGFRKDFALRTLVEDGLCIMG